MHLIFEIIYFVIVKVNVSKHLESETSCQLPACAALGDLHICTKHILAHDQHYYISEGFQK